MTSPLNPELYRRLKATFGQVVIHHPGAAFTAELVVDKLHRDRRTLTRGFGEYYAVNCPGCGDKYKRLWINHRWGTRFRGVSMHFLLHCYNEECEKRRGFISSFSRSLAGGRLDNVRILEGSREVNEVSFAGLPATLTAVHRLPAEHCAVRYLQDVRGHNIADLGQNWGVAWSDNSLSLPACYRIIFPIYGEDATGAVKLMGAQARYYDVATGSDKPADKRYPKYHTMAGTRRADLLYNGYRAKHGPYVVVTEGPFDAIRVGAATGVALLGSSMSEGQAQLLWKHWASQGKPIVLLLDADAHDKSLKIMDRLSRWPKTVYAQLPEDKDPDDLSRRELLGIIEGALHGIK